MHDYLNSKYGNGVIRHGFGNNNNYNPYYEAGYGMGFRRGVHPNIYDRNEPKLVGYLYSQDENDNEVYQLYEMHDYKTGRPGYVYRDSKYQDNRDSILVKIDQKQYVGDHLYDGDVVNIGLDNQPFVVKLYEIKTVGLGTRYTEQNYRDEMEGYALLKPVDAGDGALADDDRYYILYRQSLDPRRNRYNYYIKDKRGAILELDENKYKDLYEGDTVLIPGKERHGEYVLDTVYGDDYYTWWLGY